MNKANLIIEEVNKVIIGKEKVIRKVWMTILSGGHVLLEDVPGVGKTTMALAFSKALGLSYRRIQFTPDVMPSDLVGFYYDNKESGKCEYRQGAVMTNLLLADEINRTSSRTQSALLAIMEEGQDVYKRQNCICINEKNSHLFIKKLHCQNIFYIMYKVRKN